MLLTVLAMGVLACGAGLARGDAAGMLGTAVVGAWMCLLTTVYRWERLQGPVFDVVEGLLLAAAMAGLGMHQSLGVFYAALFFRAVTASRTRLVAGVVIYFLGQVLGAALVDGLTAQEIAQLPNQALGFTLTAFAFSVVTGTLVARGQELFRERELLAAVLDSLDVAVVACDSQGRLVKVNTSAQAAHLSTALLLHGADGDRQVRDETTAAPQESLPMRRALAGVAVRDQRVVVTDGSCARREYTVNARPVTGDDGLPVLVVAALHDVTEQRRVEERLERQALHDALTGLPNRALLADRFNQALRAGQRADSATGLLLIDLDRFKEINDTLGHHVGDQLLVQIGPRLTAALRASDTVARLGGDEFAVLLPEIGTLEAATAVANTLQTALTRSFTVDDGVDLDVEASIGVVLSGEHGHHPAELMQHADIAMYVAKQHHLGVAVYDPAANGHSPERLALLGDLRRALDNDELLLHFQPKVSLSTGQVCGAEALVRWAHPDRGLIPPDAFIPLAENTGMIGPLTTRVLDLALAQARRWADAAAPLQVAVNLSARNLLDDRLDTLVAQLLTRHDVAPALLKLEVTESAIMTDPVRAKVLLERLAALGVTLSIDDFGAGYTSLGQLKNLPITELKVDRSFVTTMETDSSNSMIVRSVVELGHNLGLSAVAEGVETTETLTQLTGFDCDVAQGYHLSRPLTADAFDTWRASWTGLPHPPHHRPQVPAARRAPA